MGITGDHVRMDAATISDTVNTASRIESLSKHYGANILLTGDSKNAIHPSDSYHFRFLGQVMVKGKNSALKLYECIDGDNRDLFLHKIETKPTFDQGMREYMNKEFAMAAVSFQTVTKRHDGDKTAMLMLKKAARLITEEVSEDWKGIEILHFK